MSMRAASMSAGSTGSRRSSVVNQLRSMGSKGAVHLNIALHGQEGSFLHSYTTLDKLEGEVTLTALQTTQIDDVNITFEGHAKTWVEKLAPTVAAATRAEAHHSFLKLTQPIDESQFPDDRTLDAGKTYTFPFTFVIPPRMVPACRHPCQSDQIRDLHSELPPSFGDPGLAGDGHALLDDMAPDMSKIWYSIQASVMRQRPNDGKSLKIAEKMKKVRVIPAFEEHAPVNAEFKSEDYKLRSEKTLRKGMLKGKLGRLTMESAQPKSLCLAPPGSVSACAVTSMATVVLRFDPADENCAPPKLSSLNTKMKVNTWFSATGMRDFPVAQTAFHDGHRGLFYEDIPLAARCVEAVKWEKQEASVRTDDDNNDAALRSPSPSSSHSGRPQPEPSARYQGGTFYTARILVPINLPKNKFFAPTFFSCLVARIYQLEIGLSIQKPGFNVSSTFRVRVRVPIQVSSAGRLSNPAERAESLLSADADADEFFLPRSIAPPAAAFTETSASPRDSAIVLSSASSPRQQPAAGAGAGAGATATGATYAPPGYSYFAGASHGVPVRIPSPVGISPGCG
ncbi:MAG: hypothetical protein M1837_001516 [Sclerophora amabilis]|nr:MAG: hypothetical protein M1837_001516 [Sclerophora amabilis]